MGTALNIQFKFTDHILLIDHIVFLLEGNNKQVEKGACGGLIEGDSELSHKQPATFRMARECHMSKHLLLCVCVVT